MALDEIHRRAVKNGKAGRFLHVHGNNVARVIASEQQDNRALLAGLQGDGRIRRFGPFAAGAGVVERADAHRGGLRLRRGCKRGRHNERAGGGNAKVDVRRIRQGDENARLVVWLRLLRLLERRPAAATPLAGRRGNLDPDGRDRFDGNCALPRSENSNQEKKDANRIHPGELAFRFAPGRGQAQPRQFVFQLVAGEFQ